MTGVVQKHTTEPTPSDHLGSLKGTWILLGFMMHRDRIRGPAWVLGLTMMLAYFSFALGTILDEQSVESFATLAATPVMALIGGPGFGFDDISVGRVLVGIYGVYMMLVAALMGILTVVRHTRVEEQTGRAELVRANMVGRHAQLAAAVVLVTIMNASASVLMGLIFHVSPAAEGTLVSSLLFGCSIGAVGLVFSGITAVTAQLSSFSRTASGIAGGILAATFVVRGLGDMSSVQDGNLGWLSWLSPFGWSQQTAPLTFDRWWPLAISLAVTSLLVLLGFGIQSRRDLAAGVLPDRLGAGFAPVWLRSSLSLAFRLQRAGLCWWTAALLVAGLTFGAFADPMLDNASGMSQEILAVFGGADGIVEGYLGFMGIFFAIMVAVYAILAVQALRGEEQGLRTEPVLAAAVSRVDWISSWVIITGLGALWLVAVAGFGNGIGAAVSTGDWSLFGRVLLGGVVQSPTVWVLLGCAVALYGLAPKLIGLSWLVLAFSGLVTLFGDMLELSDTVLATSVFRHVGQYPAESISWTAVVVMTLVSALLIVVGFLSFRRRDLDTV